MKSFIFQENRRRVVIHETYKWGKDFILKNLLEKDILFFDDCLYSQFVFIQATIHELLRKNIICILGFSSRIFRPETYEPIENAICSECHDKIHNGDISALASYMSINELKILDQYENIFIGCHGALHLNLCNMHISAIQKANLFMLDVKLAKNDFSEYGINTNIFVYPYADYDIIGSIGFLRKNGYKHIFACKDYMRIPFETIIGQSAEKDG